MPLPLLVAAGIGAGGKGIEAFANARHANSVSDQQRELFTSGSLLKTAKGFDRFFQPLIQQQTATQGIADEQNRNALVTRFAAAGLGSTGLGAALSAGASRGAAFQNQQLRADLMSRQLALAFQANQAQATALGGQQSTFGASFGAALSSFGTGVASAELAKFAQKNQTSTVNG